MMNYYKLGDNRILVVDSRVAPILSGLLRMTEKKKEVEP